MDENTAILLQIGSSRWPNTASLASSMADEGLKPVNTTLHQNCNSYRGSFSWPNTAMHRTGSDFKMQGFWIKTDFCKQLSLHLFDAFALENKK